MTALSENLDIIITAIVALLTAFGVIKGKGKVEANRQLKAAVENKEAEQRATLNSLPNRVEDLELRLERLESPERTPIPNQNTPMPGALDVPNLDVKLNSPMIDTKNTPYI